MANDASCNSKAMAPSVPRRLPRRPRPAHPKVFGVAPARQNDCRRGKNNDLLQPPSQWPLHVTLAAQPGKNGVGTIAQADLDPDLLRYLQTCPSWNSLAKERLQTQPTISKCIAAEEAVLRLKTEIPGFVDGENPRSVAA